MSSLHRLFTIWLQAKKHTFHNITITAYRLAVAYSARYCKSLPIIVIRRQAYTNSFVTKRNAFLAIMVLS